MLVFHGKQNVMEDEILNKKIKYMGIAAATLLTVVPIAAPVFNSATEITAKADTVNDSVKTGTSAAETSKVTDANTNADASTDTNEDKKTDADATSTGTTKNTTSDVTTDTNTNSNNNDELNDAEDTVNDNSVYKTSLTEDMIQTNTDDNGQPINYLSGTFPAMKDGKQIQIPYNRVGVIGDGMNSRSLIAIPHIEGYTANQDYTTFGVKRDPKTNQPIGITLANGMPIYTKNGSPTTTTTENIEAYETSTMFPDRKGQESLKDSTDITSEQKSHAQQWVKDMKSTIRLAKDTPLVTNDDVSVIYIVGSDGWFSMGSSNLTPESDIMETFSDDNHNATEFFMQFNDKNDAFFDNDNYHVFATATANDGGTKRNLAAFEINKLLSQKGGKGVTFHFGVHYVADPESGSVSIDNGNEHIVAAGGWWAQFLEGNSKQVASKDVVVLPYDADLETTGSNTNTGSTTNTGSNTNTGNTTNTGTSTNTNTNTSTTTDENTNDDKTTPVASYSSVYTPTTGTELYNDNGELITNVSLGKNTAWKVDQKKVVKGVTYLRVATNEWVKVDNGLEIKLVDSVITTNKQAILYNSKGERITNRVLGANTAWRTDRTAQINGQTMYRVATNEWIPASNVQ